MIIRDRSSARQSSVRAPKNKESKVAGSNPAGPFRPQAENNIKEESI